MDGQHRKVSGGAVRGHRSSTIRPSPQHDPSAFVPVPSNLIRTGLPMRSGAAPAEVQPKCQSEQFQTDFNIPRHQAASQSIA
jgi:hypothetical protein